MSHVTCHMSHVTYHVSGVACQVSCVKFLFYFFFLGQSGEASWWRVCYQRGLFRLVSRQRQRHIVLFLFDPEKLIDIITFLGGGGVGQAQIVSTLVCIFPNKVPIGDVAHICQTCLPKTIQIIHRAQL